MGHRLLLLLLTTTFTVDADATAMSFHHDSDRTHAMKVSSIAGLYLPAAISASDPFHRLSM